MSETLGDRLSVLMNEQGITRKRLAERTGITETAVGYYINNARLPQANILGCMAEVLGTTSDYLLKGGYQGDTDKIERLLDFQFYLIKRILEYAAGGRNLINYKDLYSECALNVPEDVEEAEKDREAVRHILNRWVAKGLVISYSEITENDKTTGIRFVAGKGRILNKLGIKEVS